MRLKISQAAEVTLGRQRAPQYEAGENLVPYLRSANIDRHRIDTTDVKSMNFTPPEQATFALADGDVLVTEGSGSRGAVGASAVWRSDLPGTVCFQNTLLRVRPRAGLSDGRYLSWWARHAHGSGQMAEAASGANILHLGSDGLKQLTLELPALREQRRIADFLDDRVTRIDNIIAARRRQMAAEHARAVSERDLQIGAALDRGGTVKVRHLVRRIEQGWSPQADSTQAEDGAWGVLKSGAVNGGIFRETENKSLPSDLRPRTEFEIGAGDLLMSRSSGSLDLIGSIAVIPGDVRSRLLLCDKIYRITPNRGVDPRFLAVSLRSSGSRSAIRLGVSGADGMANSLPSGIIRDLVVPRISDSEQAELADRVEYIDGLGDQRSQDLNRSVYLLTEYKQSLITAAVTGELDVTTASTKMPA